MDNRRFQPTAMAQVVNDEAVLINVSTGSYFSLQDVGAAIWRELVAGHTVDEMQAAVLSRYEAEPAQVRQDLEELLNDLLEQGLISPA